MHFKLPSLWMLLGLSMSLIALNDAPTEVMAWSRIKQAGTALMNRIRKPFGWMGENKARTFDLSLIKDLDDFTTAMGVLNLKGERTASEIQRIIDTVGDCINEMVPVHDVQVLDTDHVDTVVNLQDIFNFDRKPEDIPEEVPFTQSTTAPSKSEAAVLDVNSLEVPAAAMGSALEVQAENLTPAWETGPGETVETAESASTSTSGDSQSLSSPSGTSMTHEPDELQELVYRGKATSETDAAWLVYALSKTYTSVCLPKLKKLEGDMKKKFFGDKNIVRIGFHSMIAAAVASAKKNSKYDFTNFYMSGISRGDFVEPEMSFSNYFGALDPRALVDLWNIASNPNLLKALNKKKLSEKFVKSAVHGLHARLSLDIRTTTAINFIKSFTNEIYPVKLTHYQNEIKDDISAAIRIVTSHRYPLAAENLAMIVTEFFKYISSEEFRFHTSASASAPCIMGVEGDYVIKLFNEHEDTAIIKAENLIPKDISDATRVEAGILSPQFCVSMSVYNTCRRRIRGLIGRRMLKNYDKAQCKFIQRSPELYMPVRKDYVREYFNYLDKCKKSSCLEEPPQNLPLAKVNGVPEVLFTYMKRAFVRYVEAIGYYTKSRVLTI